MNKNGSLRNYRPICLLSVLYKVFTKIISRTLDEDQPQEQAGFRQGISCLDHIQTVSRIIEVPPPPHHTHCKGDATKRYCIVEAVQDGYITLRRKYENSVGTFAPIREATDQELHAHLFDLKVLPAVKMQ